MHSSRAYLKKVMTYRNRCVDFRDAQISFGGKNDDFVICAEKSACILSIDFASCLLDGLTQTCKVISPSWTA